MTKAVKSLHNKVCAYRNCMNESTTRLFFALGFSALFCQKCAEQLLADRLAVPEASNFEKQIYLDGVYDID